VTNRDLAVLGFRTMATWLFVTGAANAVASLVTWSSTAAQYGEVVAVTNLASSALYIPAGGLLWFAGDWLGSLVFRATSEIQASSLSRADLYSFASVLVGLFLLADAFSQFVYWVVVWRMSRGGSFWEAAASRQSADGVVFAVSAKAQQAAVLCKAFLGALLLAGPDRVKSGLVRIRNEFSSSTLSEDADGSQKAGVTKNGA